MDSRRINIELIYKDVDITKDIVPDLKSLSITDNASGSADDVSIELKDLSKKWISSWAPSKGDMIRPIISTVNWRYEGDSQSLNCGLFMVDEPKYSGRPLVLSLGAASIPSDTNFMTTEKSRTWDHASVKKIAQSIADSIGVGLFFDSKVNPVIDFVEQSDTPDANFLFDICQKNGLSMKLFNKRIVIFNEAEYEAKAPVITLKESDLLPGWNANTTWTDTGYDGCKVEYTNPSSGATLSYTFKAPGKSGKRIYKANETVGSLAEAERMARARLRELNKKEFTVSGSIIGNLKLFAGQTVRLTEFGIFTGKYYIDRITRTVGGGFVDSLEMHRCLEGY